LRKKRERKRSLTGWTIFVRRVYTAGDKTQSQKVDRLSNSAREEEGEEQEEEEEVKALVQGGREEIMCPGLTEHRRRSGLAGKRS
jgi:hypothetical protein